MSSFFLLSQALTFKCGRKYEKKKNRINPEKKSLSVCFLKMIFMNENLLSDDVIGFDCDDEFIYTYWQFSYFSIALLIFFLLFF